MTERDQLILAWWRFGLWAEVIGWLMHMPEARVFHELNRILREAAPR
jgi:hypothetical protein